MIKDFTIEGFKGFPHIKLNRITQFTLIGGKNNFGKSSLLEAMFLFLDRRNIAMFVRQQAWRGVTMIPAEAAFLWGPFFYDFDLGKPIRLSIDSKKEELTLGYVENYHSARPVPVQNLALQPGSQVAKGGQAISLTLRKDAKIQSKTYLVLDQGGLSLFEEAQKERLGKVDFSGGQEELLAAMRLFDPRLLSFTTIKSGDSVQIYADIGLSRKVPVSFAGEGFSRALSILLAIMTVPKGIVFIDELENGIHHSILESLWAHLLRAATKYEVQLIVTTHSAEMIRSAHLATAKDASQDFTYLRLGRDKDGSTKAHVFDHEQLGVALESEFEVR